MSNITKIYPHVNVTTNALIRPVAEAIDNGATTLFVPFKAKKGMSDQIQKIFNLSQFIAEYGEADFSYQGRTVLNIYNWLNAGGAIYALRLVGKGGAAATGKLTSQSVDYLNVTAKNKGAYYNSVTLELSKSIYSGNFLDAVVKVNSVPELRLYKLSADDFDTKLTATPYFGSVTLASTKTFADILLLNTIPPISFSGGSDGSEKLDDLVAAFFNKATDISVPSGGGAAPLISSIYAADTISNKLEYPIDMILDAGLSATAKTAIVEFTKESGIRSDITVVLDQFDFSTSSLGVAAAPSTTSLNHAVYAQKLSVYDIISGRDIWVTPTYFLSSLFPFNDRIYGIQWPTAGLTRGVLNGVKGINENPTETQKTAYYNSKVNYIEKDSRGYKFMSQLTSEAENTALRFLNNSRVARKMVRDLEELGRDYLFEFNDTATLNNMRNALTRYVNEWIQNRTLSFGEVFVEKDQYSDERVNVSLNIRFTGTIEIISVEITIE